MLVSVCFNKKETQFSTYLKQSLRVAYEMSYGKRTGIQVSVGVLSQNKSAPFPARFFSIYVRLHGASQRASNQFIVSSRHAKFGNKSTSIHRAPFVLTKIPCNSNLVMDIRYTAHNCIELKFSGSLWIIMVII